MPEERAATERRHPDRRVVRTRAAIDRAFRSLLAQMPYDRITVSAIAREAGINRKTFYLHYLSVEELLSHVIQQAVTEAAHTANFRANMDHSIDDIRGLTRTIIVELLQNPLVRDNVSEGVPLHRVLELTREPLSELIAERRREAGLPEVPHLDYYISGYLSGVIAVYETWTEKGEEPETVDGLCDIVTDIFSGKALGEV